MAPNITRQLSIPTSFDYEMNLLIITRQVDRRINPTHKIIRILFSKLEYIIMQSQRINTYRDHRCYLQTMTHVPAYEADTGNIIEQINQMQMLYSEYHVSETEI